MAQYAEIVSIVAPKSAVAGQRVDIEVTVRNLYSSTIGIMVGGALEYGPTKWPKITFPVYSYNTPGGSTHTFEGYFTMPAADTTIHAYSYYYAGTWYPDDEKTKDITAWVKLATASLMVKSSAVGLWIPLAESSMLLSKALTNLWIPIAEGSLLVTKAITGGWIPLAHGELALSVGMAHGQDIFKGLGVEFLKKYPVSS